MQLRPLLDTRAPGLTVLIRLMVGSVFLSEGLQKFLFPAALGVGRFAKIGFAHPEILAPMVGTFEIVCGALVLIGLMTRAARLQSLVVILLVAAAASGCQLRPAYRPRAQEITITTVPLLVREAKGLYPFLAADFAAGGVLEGKEVYAFSPSTVTVIEGDTIHFTLINPEDDEHAFLLPGCTADDVGSFVPPDCGVDLPPQRVTHATYVTRRAGINPILCKITKHLPMMSGQLIVLPAAMMTGSGQGGDR